MLIVRELYGQTQYGTEFWPEVSAALFSLEKDLTTKLIAFNMLSLDSSLKKLYEKSLMLQKHEEKR